MKVKKMVFTTKKNKTRIVFDDFVNDGDENDFHYWAYMCPKCHNKYRNALKGRCSDNPSYDTICSVDGCDGDATWYIDFDGRDDISFIEEEDQSV